MPRLKPTSCRCFPATRSSLKLSRSFSLFLFLVLLLSATSCRQKDAHFTLVPSADQKTPLVARARLVASRPCRVVAIRIRDGVDSELETGFSTEHDLTILGFKPDSSHEVRLDYQFEGESEIRTTLPQVMVTPPLPEEFPLIESRRFEAGPEEGGFVLVSLVPQGPGSPLAQPGYLILCNTQGQVIWFHRLDRSPTDVRLDPEGFLTFQTLSGLDTLKMDWNGVSDRRWVSTGLKKDDRIGMPVDLETVHHDFWLLEDGSFWTLSSKKRDKNIDETIVHVAPDGSILKEISLMDELDPTRELYPPHPNFWELFYGPGVVDWGHSNSLYLDSSQKEALVSLRHQDAVVNVDLESGRVEWILGRPDGWSPELKKRLLRGHEDLEWFAKQHAAKWTGRGKVMMFDNGRKRSRAVEYEIDVKARTVKEAWSFEDDAPFFSEYFGDVDILPNTGNVQITDGARKDEKGHDWARVVEVTHGNPSRKILELLFTRPGTKGCTIYRAERLSSLYGKS